VAKDPPALVQPVFDRFTEGFDTAELKAAKALLDALDSPASRIWRKPPHRSTTMRA
jgi:hypothetical protein